MFNEKLNEDVSRIQDKVIGLDLEAFAQGYMAMADINLQIANEDYHLETEATYSIEKAIGTSNASW